MMTLEQILEQLGRLSELTRDELTELADAISALYTEVREGDLDDSTVEALEELVSAAGQVDTEIARRAEADAEREERLAALDARMSGDESDDAEGDEGEEDADGEEGGETDDAGETADETDETDEGAAAEGEREPVAASSPRFRSLAAITRNQSRRTREAPAELGAAVVTAATDVPGFAAGARIRTADEFGRALAERHRTVAAQPLPNGMPAQRYRAMSIESTRQRVTIPQVHSPEQVNDLFDEATRLHLDSVDAQLAQLRPESHDVLLAAGGPCVPAEPDYSIEFVGTDVRPFTGALPSANYPRGKVSFYPPVCFDRTGLTGIGVTFTEAEDTSGAEYPKPCERIDCPDPVECDLELIVKCLTIGNWIDRTFPEYVRVFREQVDALYAMRFEQTHMAQMVAGSTILTVSAAQYGATIDAIGHVLRVVAHVNSARRLPTSQRWSYQVPSWVIPLLKMDLSRYLGGTQQAGFGGFSITDAQIVGWFAQHNVLLSTYLDESGPTTVAGADNQVLPVPVAGALPDFPGSFRAFLHPVGTWIRGTGGTLDLGVVRDSALNAVNDFQVFMEEWSALCFRGCDSFVIDAEVCPNGAAGAAVTVTC